MSVLEGVRCALLACTTIGIGADHRPQSALETSAGVRVIDTVSGTRGEHFGFAVTSLGDVGGDGFDDFAVGAVGGAPESPGSGGYASVHSGCDRSRLYAIDAGPSSEPGAPGEPDDYGVVIGALDDLDRDGARDFVVLGREREPWGQAFADVLSGRAGRRLARFRGIDLFDHGWYLDEAGVTAIPDLDGDGKGDLALWRSTSPPQSIVVTSRRLEPGRLRRGAIVAALPDADGDGREEWLRFRGSNFLSFDWAGAKNPDGEYFPDPKLPTGTRDDGRALASCWVDWAGDGRLGRLQVWAVGSPLRGAADSRRPRAAVTVNDLATGELIDSWELTADFDGWVGAVTAVGDLSGDGCEEVVIALREGHGAPRSVVRIYSARDSSLRWSIRGTSTTALGTSACSIGDLDGDGKRELLLGDPEAAGAGPCSGAVHVIGLDE